jgi:glutathione synthase/RimK-type ligase-like ATP-grasp enzyme
MTEPFVTLESFVKDRDYDLRIQKIGDHYRAYKRVSLSGNWKTNVGSSQLEEIEVTDEYRRWGELAGSLFGGMQILTVDALHTSSGEHLIIEINDSASGLAHNNEHTDMRHIAQLVISRLDARIAK